MSMITTEVLVRRYQLEKASVSTLDELANILERYSSAVDPLSRRIREWAIISVQGDFASSVDELEQHVIERIDRLFNEILVNPY